MTQTINFRILPILALFVFASLPITKQSDQNIRLLQIFQDPVVQAAYDSNLKATTAAAAVSLNTPVLALSLALATVQSTQKQIQSALVAAALLADEKAAIALKTLEIFTQAAQVVDSCKKQANLALVTAYAAAIVPLTKQNCDANLVQANFLQTLTTATKLFLVNNALRAAMSATLAQAASTADPANKMKTFQLAESNFDQSTAILAAGYGDTLVTFVGTSRQAAFAATLMMNPGNVAAAQSGAVNAAEKAMFASVTFDYALQVQKDTVTKAIAAAAQANLAVEVGLKEAKGGK